MTANTSPRVPHAEAARALLRESVLDAAVELLADGGWNAVRMADVAAAVGVSRQTLYKHFSSKQALGEGVVFREVDRFLGAVDHALDAHPDDLPAGIAAAAETFLTTAADNPVVKTILTGDDEAGLLPLVTTRSEPLITVATDRVAEHVLANWPGADPRKVRLAADTAVRAAISHAIAPEGPTESTAAGLAEVLGPYLSTLTTPAEGNDA